MIFTKITLAVIICLAYIISLIVIFFVKDYIRNEETKIYRFLLLLSAIGLIIHLIAENVCYYFDTLPRFISFIVLKSMLVYYLLFGVILLIYLITIAKFKNRKKIIKAINITTLLLIAFFLFLPMHVYRDVNEMNFYTYGIDVNLLYIVSSLVVVMMIIVLLIKHKDISTKKTIPLFIFIIGGAISMAIQLKFPYITLTELIESVICCMMYFTIENPDIKMVEQLEVAKEEADRANAAKTDFLSSMSHEIRTPLNAIVGFSELIKEAKTLDEAKTNARDITNASQTLLEIVNGILDISKIEAGKLEIVESPYNARETFEDLAKLIQPRMDEKGLDFQYSIAPDIPPILYGDHANIKKIITNFLSNAVKYTNEGFVKYDVVCVNTDKRCKLIITVEDSGRGIKKDSATHLFEKFDRLDVEKNSTIEGTGLGLAITKQLVEMMGGKIIVHTVYKKGSKFTVILEQKIDKNAVVEVEKVSDNLNLKGIKILLVDDNDLNIKVGSKLLEKFGATDIDSANNGFECIDRVRDRQYDVILLDDMMPKKSGTETLKDLKQLAGFHTPTIALTANAIAGMRESYIAAGFDEYLSKPINKQELVKVLNKILKNKLSDTPVEEPSHIIENSPPTNATDVPTEMVNSVVETHQEEDGTNKIEISFGGEKTNTEKVETASEEKKEEKPKVEEPKEEPREENPFTKVEFHFSNEDEEESNKNIEIEIAPKTEEKEETKVEEEVKEEPVKEEQTEVEETKESESTEESVQEDKVEESTPEEEPAKEENIEVPVEPSDETDEQFLRNRGVDMDKALELLGDMEMYNMTMEDFASTLESKWSKLEEEKLQNDMENYAIDVHSLKSDCKYLGFYDLADVAYEHELKSKENDSQFVNDNFERLTNEYEKVLNTVNEYKDRHK